MEASVPQQCRYMLEVGSPAPFSLDREMAARPLKQQSWWMMASGKAYACCMLLELVARLSTRDGAASK